MSALAAIVKCVDHVVIQVEDPEPLFSLFTGPLDLPVAWPIQRGDWYTSGGICVGNACLEIAEIAHIDRRRRRVARNAHLLGIALLPIGLDASLRELVMRGIPHSLPVPHFGEHADGTRSVRWTNVLLGGLAGEGGSILLRSRWWTQGTPIGRALAALSRITFRSYWASLAWSDTGRFAVYMRDYAPELVEALAEQQAVFSERRGGPLELVGLAEVIVGAVHPERVRQRWQNLLAPLLPVDRGYWQPASGPGLRIEPHDEDTLLAIVLRTRSLARAEAWLREAQMLGGVVAGQVTIDRAAVCGLDIRLTE
jgi:hypothetical protein